MIFRPNNRGSSHSLKRSFNPDNPCCLVLGGGGARGLAHLGAMQAIAETRVPVHRVVGVSMGALMGAFCLVEGDPRRAQQNAMQFLDSIEGRKLQSSVSSGGGLSGSANRRWGTKVLRKLIKHTLVSKLVTSKSLLSGKILRDLISPLVPDIDIRDLPTPFQIATVDLHSGRRVMLDSGPLRSAIQASMSIPGIFPAVQHGDQLLSDIGAYDLVPCDAPPSHQFVKSGPENVIAVDVGQKIDERTNCNSALDAVLRTQFLAEQKMRQISLSKADVVIRPQLRNSEWFDFSSPESIIQAGYNAAAHSLGLNELPVVETGTIASI